jgi:peptidoglycan/xylan/chitin deacetylase (PgdA/CDA1 family)
MSIPTRQGLLSLGRGLAAATCVWAASSAWAQSGDCLAPATPIQSIDMRVLVVAADGNESVLPAIRNTLEYIGIPYDVVLATNDVLSQDRLCTMAGAYGVAKYQGVVLTTGGLSYFNQGTQTWESAFTTEEWSRLSQYQAKYRVRQATLYTYPGGSLPDGYGLGTPSPLWGAATTLTTTLTTAGRLVFPYLQPTAQIVIRNAWVYQAPATTATPLLSDASGNAIVSINNYPDGRQNLAVTADGNPYLLHSVALGYGIVNWVTKGLYVGERRVYMSPQPDDLLLDNDMWDPAANSDQTGKTYRITDADYKKYREWQNKRNSDRLGSIVTEMPFNGLGTDKLVYPNQKLPDAVRGNQSSFHWLSHTYSHPYLDNVTYTEMLSELQANHQVATTNLKFSSYFKDALVTPNITGLNNAEALRAMHDFGVRYLVSDTSKFCGHRDAVRAAQMGCPRPNVGIYNDLQPSVLMIPRYPANLFYNVSTPTEWVSEYNFIYRSYWGRDLTYTEILEAEGDVWMNYMFNFDMRPVMFHQANMRAYDGTRSLLGDLIDRTIAKYSTIYNLPPRSRTQRQIGNLMAQRMVLNDAVKPATGAPLTARIVPGTTTSTIVVNNPTGTAVTVPLTGVNLSGAASRETYGGQTTSRVVVNGNGASVTVTGAPAW